MSWCVESVQDLNERLRRELIDLEGQIQQEHRQPAQPAYQPRTVTQHQNQGWR